MSDYYDENTLFTDEDIVGRADLSTGDEDLNMPALDDDQDDQDDHDDDDDDAGLAHQRLRLALALSQAGHPVDAHQLKHLSTCEALLDFAIGQLEGGAASRGSLDQGSLDQGSATEEQRPYLMSTSVQLATGGRRQMDSEQLAALNLARLRARRISAGCKPSDDGQLKTNTSVGDLPRREDLLKLVEHSSLRLPGAKGPGNLAEAARRYSGDLLESRPNQTKTSPPPERSDNEMAKLAKQRAKMLR